ncbi:hypothetical protein NDU88_006202 [Pleurodeles waltl]|uniref:Secreted protein n=1 Tax=Pleurodeles waltl TaxID=8319 RepID=A0AAV7RNA5_PLEWA|nr:hypothetical protein NDU88_006202 [Pleurodeles waltl]
MRSSPRHSLPLSVVPVNVVFMQCRASWLTLNLLCCFSRIYKRRVSKTKLLLCSTKFPLGYFCMPDLYRKPFAMVLMETCLQTLLQDQISPHGVNPCGLRGTRCALRKFLISRSTAPPNFLLHHACFILVFPALGPYAEL